MHRARPGAVERSAALHLAGAALLVALLVLPVMGPGPDGDAATLLDVLRGLVAREAWPLALLVGAVVLAAPLLRALLALRLVLGGEGSEALRRARSASLIWLQRLAPWSMAAVLLLAVLTAALAARVVIEPVPGIGLAVLVAAALLLTAADAAFEPVEAWTRVAPQSSAEILRPSAGSRLSVCVTCGQVARHTDRSRRRLMALCPRCGAPLDPGPDRRGQAAVAWALGGLVLYALAPLVPVAAGDGSGATIAGALAALAAAGGDRVAVVLLTAAVALPVASLAGALLLAATHGSAPVRARARRVRLHRALLGVTPLAMLAVLAPAWLAAGWSGGLGPGPALLCLAGAVLSALVALDRLEPRVARHAPTTEEADVPSARA